MKPELLSESPLIIKSFLGYLETIKGKSEKTVEEYYSEYPSLSCNSDLIHFLNTKYEEVARGAEEGIWKMSIDEFNQEMEEIREDELY